MRPEKPDVTRPVPPMPTDAAPRGPILMTSAGFTSWLAKARASLACTTYQTGRVIVFGLRPTARCAAMNA